MLLVIHIFTGSEHDFRFLCFSLLLGRLLCSHLFIVSPHIKPQFAKSLYLGYIIHPGNRIKLPVTLISGFNLMWQTPNGVGHSKWQLQFDVYPKDNQSEPKSARLFNTGWWIKPTEECFLCSANWSWCSWKERWICGENVRTNKGDTFHCVADPFMSTCIFFRVFKHTCSARNQTNKGHVLMGPKRASLGTIPEFGLLVLLTACCILSQLKYFSSLSECFWNWFLFLTMQAKGI